MKARGLLIYAILFSYSLLGQNIILNKNVLKYECKLWIRSKPEGYAQLYPEHNKKKQEYLEFLEIKDSVFYSYSRCNNFRDIDSCIEKYNYLYYKSKQGISIKFMDENIIKVKKLFSFVKNDTIDIQGDFGYLNALEFLGNKWVFYEMKKIKHSNKSINCYVFKSVDNANYERVSYYYIAEDSLIPVLIKKYYVKKKGMRRKKIEYIKKLADDSNL